MSSYAPINLKHQHPPSPPTGNPRAFDTFPSPGSGAFSWSHAWRAMWKCGAILEVQCNEYLSLFKTWPSHSINLIDLFYVSCEILIERVISFNFAAMTFTPLLKKWPRGWGIWTGFGARGRGIWPLKIRKVKCMKGKAWPFTKDHLKMCGPPHLPLTLLDTTGHFWPIVYVYFN